MPRINIKPISLNQAYRGRRFATQALKDYKKALSLLLPKKSLPKGKLGVYYEFGVSSKGSDGDNLIKAFQDCLSEKYGFNDNKIYEWHVKKKDVAKGEEYIDFEIDLC
jgi:Holliday junction resolvase RusA-like endonuclease